MWFCTTKQPLTPVTPVVTPPVTTTADFNSCMINMDSNVVDRPKASIAVCEPKTHTQKLPGNHTCRDGKTRLEPRNPLAQLGYPEIGAPMGELQGESKLRAETPTQLCCRHTQSRCRCPRELSVGLVHAHLLLCRCTYWCIMHLRDGAWGKRVQTGRRDKKLQGVSNKRNFIWCQEHRMKSFFFVICIFYHANSTPEQHELKIYS